jgi:putative transposase
LSLEDAGSSRANLLDRRSSLLTGQIEALREATRRAHERGIWQRRFWKHLIRDEEDYGRHAEYCHINPVKHALVAHVRDWPFSSFHRDVAASLFPQDWSGELETLGAHGNVTCV